MKPAPAKITKRATAPAPRPRVWERLGKSDGALVAAIAAVTAMVYLRCLGNGYVFDDHEMILVNRYIGQWSFLWRALVNDSWWFRDPAHLPQSHYYRPLQDIWLGLNYQIFGFNPVGPHGLMVGLHLVAVAFVYGIAARLAVDRVAGLCTALLFGLLPVHAEAVIWATAIPESLAGTLQLGAFYFYLRYRDEGFPNGLAWSMVLFGGALLSHESAIGFPLLLVAHGFVFAKGARPGPLPGQGEGTDGVDQTQKTEAGVGLRERGRDALARALPFIALAVLYLGARLAVLGFITRRDVNNHATLAQIIFTIPTVVVHNLADIIVPWQAGPSHRITWVGSAGSADFWMPALGLGLIATAGAIALADSPNRKVYLFSAAWVFIAMAPVLNLGILYPNALVADRYLYFSSFGYCLAVGVAVAATGHAYAGLARPIGAAMGLLAMIYGLTLWQVQHFWHDEIALFGRCIERFPDSGFCHNRLGMALQAAGDLDGAEHELSVALRLDAGDYAAQYDLAMVHAQQGHYAQAAHEAAGALKHLPNAPASAYINLAQLYDAADDRSAREAAFTQAQKLPGAAFDVALARARVSLAHKDGAGAERQLKDLLAQAPDDPRALLMLGSAMAVQKRYEDALDSYERAQRIVAGNSTIGFLIALTLHNLGRDREASAQCQTVLQAEPANPNARALLELIQRGRHPPGASSQAPGSEPR